MFYFLSFLSIYITKLLQAKKQVNNASLKRRTCVSATAQGYAGLILDAQQEAEKDQVFGYAMSLFNRRKKGNSLAKCVPLMIKVTSVRTWLAKGIL